MKIIESEVVCRLLFFKFAKRDPENTKTLHLGSWVVKWVIQSTPSTPSIHDPWVGMGDPWIRSMDWVKVKCAR
jgi:hypothetical protein